MLKRKSSPYLAGRPKGHWWKWKRAALTLDCVLMYAQRGSGKRSSYYSDYTFGVWREARRASAADDGRELVPVGQGLLGLHRRGAAPPRPLRAHAHDRAVRPRARGRAQARARGGVRRRVSVDPAQVRRRHALSAHPPHPLGQAGGEADTIETVRGLLAAPARTRLLQDRPWRILIRQTILPLSPRKAREVLRRECAKTFPANPVGNGAAKNGNFYPCRKGIIPLEPGP